MTKTTIRRAEPRDAPTLAALGRTTFSQTFAHLYPPEDLQAFLAEAYSPDRMEQELADPDKAAWLAEWEGEAVGYATAGPCGLAHAEVTPQCGELKRLYVLEGWKGEGVAKALMDVAMAWLEETRTGRLWLGVWSENWRAQRFYARLGFEKVGEHHFKVGQTLDRDFIYRRG
jgi:ribosomal protein S18 acetylase RimI-like enzyme